MLPVMTVSEFISQINEIVAGIYVLEGEVSGYHCRQWIFFDLKDGQSTLNCFSTVFKIKEPLADGMKIRVTGHPEIYEKTGKFTFIVDQVELVGEGTFKKAYLLLKEKLTQEGLFAAEHKRALPELPGRIGVIASRDSAAFGDFKRIVDNRWAGLEIILRHVAVQGSSAVSDIVRAFRDLNSYLPAMDLIVLMRGGGSWEDLAAFNSEEVARAIYGSRIPVISGVGHERDETLADLAADVRASTPSNAGEIAVPHRLDFTEQLNSQLEKISKDLEHRFTGEKYKLEQNFYAMAGFMEQHLQSGEVLIEEFKNILDSTLNNLRSKREFVENSEILFKNVDYHQVLKRGYSITRNKAGKIVKK